MAGSLAPRAFEYWLTVYRRTWRGSVVSEILAPVFYLASLGFGLGSLVDKGGHAGVAGVPYAIFVAPGVLAAAAMQTVVGHLTYPVLGAIKWQRQYHAMLAGPLGVFDLVVGQLAFAILRVFVGSVLFVVIGAVLGAFTLGWGLLAISAAMLGGLAHAGPVLAFSSQQETGTGFNVLNRFFVVPMFLFAGTFFPVDQLPVMLRPLAWSTPLWNATALCRDLALHTLQPGPAAWHLLYLLLWVIAGTWLATVGLRRRLLQ